MVTDARDDPLSSPLTPVYAFGPLGTDVDLYAGPAKIGDLDIGPMRVQLTMSGELRICWEADHAQEVGPATLLIDHPSYGRTPLLTHVTSTSGRGEIDPSDLGAANSALTRAVVHWINLPFMLPADRLTAGGASWAGRGTFDAAGWRFVLDARRDLVSHGTELLNSRAFLITHTADLSRADGSTFTVTDVEEVLYAWQTALSFALGRWVAPALPVGFDGDRRVWEKWAAWRCDPAVANYHWWDTYQWGDLSDFTRRFIDAWFSADHDVVRHLAHHLICANHPTTTLEARLMLVQSALEYLGWTNNVLTGLTPKKDYEKQFAHERIRTLLGAAHIPPDLPRELTALGALATHKPMDGPEAVTWMRNRLVHPKDAGEPYRVHHALLEAWQLSMHYGELLLLQRLGYNGAYLRRFPTGGFAHAHEPVPWTTATPAKGP